MTDTTRDAFEAWARKECDATDSDLRWNQHGYVWNEWGRAFKTWQAATEQGKRQPLTEDQQVACLVKSGCIGTVKMSFEAGPYDITRPSINASKLIEAIETAITATPQGNP